MPSCPNCGTVNHENMNTDSEAFPCKKCGEDLNGSETISTEKSKKVPVRKYTQSTALDRNLGRRECGKVTFFYCLTLAFFWIYAVISTQVEVPFLHWEISRYANIEISNSILCLIIIIVSAILYFSVLLDVKTFAIPSIFIGYALVKIYIIPNYIKFIYSIDGKFTYLYFFWNILLILSMFTAAFFIYEFQKPNSNIPLKSFFFIPSLLLLLHLYYFAGYVNLVSFSFPQEYKVYMVGQLSLSLGIFFFLLYLKTKCETNELFTYVSIGTHVLLLFASCGAWGCIWVKNTTALLIESEDDTFKTPNKTLLLLCFVPFFYIYWYYKTAQIIEEMYREKGMHSEIATLTLITAIFIPIVPYIIIQDKLNSLY